MGLFDFSDNERARKRTLSIRDKQILLRRAKGRCENCGEPLEFDGMTVGHKTAWSKGGGTTFRNSVALCYRCNKLQGTDSWDVFQRKQGKESKEPKAKVERSKAKRKKKSKRQDDDEWGFEFPDLGKLF